MELMVPHNRTYKIGPFYSSEIEIIDITKAWIAISVAFAIINVGVSAVFNIKFLTSFLFSAITVGLGFIAHEMGHKVVAQKYGCFAEFRADNMMLIFAIVLAIAIRIVFAAPGAVMISGHQVDRKRLGYIGAAGPIMSLSIALIFFILYLVSNPLSLLGTVSGYGFAINSFIALFNMIPFGMFDGYKIFQGSKMMWLVMTVIAGIATWYSWVLF